MNNELISELQQRIALSESRLSSLEKTASDPEVWAECGYYLQQDINNEISYCSVLYDKLHRLQCNSK